MSLQTIIDRAQEIEIDKRRIVAQTVSRSQRIKTAERNTAQPMRLIVTPPGALKWQDSREIIAAIDSADRVTESEISLNNNSGMNYITEYRGELTQTMLDGLTISASNTATITSNSLPAIDSTLTSRTYTMTAVSFSEASNATYNRALSATRTDFLITNAEYDAHFYSIRPGDTLSVATYITSAQTIVSTTRNYFTLNGVGYTRIVMSDVADANSTVASTDGSENISVVSALETYVSSSTVMFRPGDIIQPDNSRYPYTVTGTVLRGTDTTVVIPLGRNIITSESITLIGQGLKVGNDCTWRMVVTGLPTYKLIPGKLVQYTGNFEMVEKVI